ncbi:hypothetical protein F1559_002387 [Cyanidiococcus yangmingshanensis]|uniref:Uncharacterized protein n=1 Tax=Cyanidiococcus yangmingshanensis TaxID=2690220 RepID=A0A7J7IG38_9RHOD|nr:hypothetical protein F1559_002387 [Cyanidiococcus yangmingshanensis]
MRSYTTPMSSTNQTTRRRVAGIDWLSHIVGVLGIRVITNDGAVDGVTKTTIHFHGSGIRYPHKEIDEIRPSISFGDTLQVLHQCTSKSESTVLGSEPLLQRRVHAAYDQCPQSYLKCTPSKCRLALEQRVAATASE